MEVVSILLYMMYYEIKKYKRCVGLYLFLWCSLCNCKKKIQAMDVE